MSSHKMERISQDFKRVASNILMNLKDPRVPPLSSVTAVQITPDLKFAKIYVSVMSDDKEIIAEALKGLSSAAGFFRKEIAAKLDLRNTPQITFEADNSISHAIHINKIINDLNIERDTSDED